MEADCVDIGDCCVTVRPERSNCFCDVDADENTPTISDYGQVNYLSSTLREARFCIYIL